MFSVLDGASEEPLALPPDVVVPYSRPTAGLGPAKLEVTDL